MSKVDSAVASNQAGVQLTANGRVLVGAGASESWSNAVLTPTLQLAEPRLQWTPSPAFWNSSSGPVQAGEIVWVEVNISHLLVGGASTAPAYDIYVRNGVDSAMYALRPGSVSLSGVGAVLNSASETDFEIYLSERP